MQHLKRVPEAQEKTNPVGRPPADKPKAPEIDAEETVNEGKVSIRCAHCGRGMSGKITHRLENGTRYVTCSLCRGRNEWRPGTVRAV